MKEKLTFLGIETSCDETAASVVQENTGSTAKVLSNIVSSQIKEHERFGGVVPEIAARAHIENIDFIIQEALDKSKKKDQRYGWNSCNSRTRISCLFKYWT